MKDGIDSNNSSVGGHLSTYVAIVVLTMEHDVKPVKSWYDLESREIERMWIDEAYARSCQIINVRANKGVTYPYSKFAKFIHFSSTISDLVIESLVESGKICIRRDEHGCIVIQVL